MIFYSKLQTNVSMYLQILFIQLMLGNDERNSEEFVLRSNQYKHIQTVNKFTVFFNIYVTTNYFYVYGSKKKFTTVNKKLFLPLLILG